MPLILVPATSVLVPVGSLENALALHHALNKVSLVLVSIWPLEHPILP